MDEDKVLAALAALRNEVMALRGEMTGLRGEMTGLRDGATELRSVMMGKFEQVQNELTAIKSDLSVAGFAAMRAVKRTDADREDMRDLNELVNKLLATMLRLRTDVDELRDRK